MNTPESVLGYAVDTFSAEQCADDIVENCIARDSKRWLACFNPHSYVEATRDRTFRDALKSADYLVPDGVGVVYASRLMGGSIKARVTGSDVFSAVNAVASARGASVFLLGSTEETLSRLASKLEQEYPGLKVAETYSPPFKAEFSEEDIDNMVAAVNAVAPDILWVAMTAPKQEKWIAGVIDRLDVRFAAAVGAVFDFYIGNVKRSHPIFRRLGLEWLPRLLRQPRRLWRRTFVSAPIFVWHALKARVGLGVNEAGS